MLQPLIAGNAVRVFIEPLAGSAQWRILKKASDTFTGADDPSAVVVYQGDEKVIVDVDVNSTPNGMLLFYRAYYLTAAGAWVASASRSTTPAANYEEHTTDVMSLVRDRLQAFLTVEVERGNIMAQELGYVQVFTAPPSLERDMRFPLVTIGLDHEDPTDRGIGENISGDEFDADGLGWFDSDGWLANVQLTITAWSLNSDERIELRKALRRFVIANIPVFDSVGMVMVSLSVADNDAVNGEYGSTPIYQTMGTFTCVAPVRVGSVQSSVTAVIFGGFTNG